MPTTHAVAEILKAAKTNGRADGTRTFQSTVQVLAAHSRPHVRFAAAP